MTPRPDGQIGVASVAASLGLAVVCAIARPAAAQVHPIGLNVRTIAVWDSNVFRVSDSAPDPQLARGVSGKSDRIVTTLFGLVLDKSYSQQRVQLQLTQTAVRHDNFSALNRDAFEYRGNVQWHLTPRISGSLTASRSESLVSFEDERIAQRVVRVTTTRGANVEGLLFGGWYLLAGVSESTASSGQAALAVPDSSQTTENFGIRYVSKSSNSITLNRRLTQGTNGVTSGIFAGGAFTQQEVEASGTWMASGKSSFSGRVAKIERHNENFSQGDFSGAAGELRYSWDPTSKLNFSASAGRTLAPYFTAGSTYRVEDSASVSPVWRLSQKITLRARLERRELSLLGQSASFSRVERRDVLRGGEITADWAVHPKALLSATLRTDRRVSTEQGAAFKATLATLSASLNF